MALTIDKVHERLDFLIKKNKWGYISPQQKDLALDLAQMDLFTDYYGDPNQYQYERPIPPIAHGQNQKLNDSLSRFLKVIILDGADGFKAFPSDYVHLDSAFLIDNSTTRPTYIPLKLVTSDRVAFRSNSQLRPAQPSDGFKNAFISISVQYSSGDVGIQLYPREDPAPIIAYAYYLSRPEPPVYSYTQSGRTITYVEGSSTQLNWQDDDITSKIIPKAIEYIGINLQDDRLFQQGQIKDKD